MRNSRLSQVAGAWLLAVGIGSAQSSQEWLVPMNGNQPGQLQWTLPGPLAADAQGRVLAAAYVREFQVSGATPVVAELLTLSDAGGQTLLSQSATTSRIVADVQASPTGGFLTLGSDSAINGLKLRWYHPDGIQQWTQTVPNSNGPQPHGLAVDAQGTAYLCGYNFIGGLVVAAVDSTGALLWTRDIDYGAGTTSEPAGLEYDGGSALYVRASVSLAAPPYTKSLRVSKLSSAGVVQWTRTAPGQTSIGFTMLGYQAIHADSGGVVIGGETLIGGTQALGFLAHYDSAGTLQWSNTIQGTDDSTFVDRIAAATDGSLWVVTQANLVSQPPPMSGSVIVSRFSAQGTPLSSVMYAPPSTQRAVGVGLILGTAGQAWVPIISFKNQQTPSPVIRSWLLLFDSNGALAASQQLDPTAAVNDETIAFARAAPGNRLVLSGGEGQSYGDEAFAIKLDLGESPQGYCTAKINSLGCTPTLRSTGFPSAAATQGFGVHVGNVPDHKAGLFLYGVSGAAALPFQNGTLCVQAPIKRTPPISSGGTTGCTGIYSLDFNAFAHGVLGGTPLPALLSVGTSVYCQAWGRDPGFAAPNNTTLSSALSYTVMP